jgi:hypothetical protein
VLSLVGIAPKPAATYTPAPFRVTNNPYRARKRWPPDFRTLDPKQQFHFEKTYRRRAALKWARPRWNKGVKLVQQTLITFTIIYFVFICEPGHGMGTPFDGVSLSSPLSLMLGPLELAFGSRFFALLCSFFSVTDCALLFSATRAWASDE